MVESPEALTTGDAAIHPTGSPFAWRLAFAAGAVVVAYNGSMLLHEFGHVIHLWVSGGTVAGVRVSPIDVSYVYKGDNPHPQFVAWGGPVWGAVLPAALVALACAARSRMTALALVLATFALVFNGGYLTVGAFQPGGDTAQLLQHGAPVWSLVAAGLPMLAAGVLVASRVPSALDIGHGRTTLVQSVLVVGLPLGGYLATIVIALAIKYRLGVMLPLVAGPAALAVGAVVGFALHRVSTPHAPSGRIARPGRTEAVVALALAVVLVAAELAWLS